MGCRNFSKYLKGEEAFLSQTLVKVENDKVKQVEKFVHKWNLIPLQLGTGQ